MAHRDKSQGFGFIYSDIQTLLRQRGELSKMDQWEPIDSPAEAQSVNLNKDVTDGRASSSQAPAQPSVEQIKENLDRLAKLHQKLHVMLDEINRLSNSKKNDN